MRKQTLLVTFAAAIVFAVRCFADVNGVAGAVSWLIGLASGVVLVSMWHFSRKWYMDHAGVSMRQLFAEASPDARLNTVAMMALAMAILFAAATAHAQDVRTVVPSQALQYMPTLRGALDRDWPGAPVRAYVPALIDYESGCFYLRRMCWNPKAEFKTQREHGVGFTQFTVAYDKSGNVRFDKIAELAERYPQLRTLTWANVMDRADLQLEGSVLGVRDTWRSYAGVPAAMQFTDSAWNCGNNCVNRSRRTCKLAANCNPNLWFGNVELYCMQGHTALYGTRSACDINRMHVRSVTDRVDKYKGLV